MIRHLSCVVTALLAALPAMAHAYDAQDIATREYAGMKRALCPAPDAGTGAAETPAQAFTPTRVFDNLYQLGNRSTSAWALTTSDGIILFEAMSHDNVEETVVREMRQLGLDPAAIRYLIISHGHNDHFGGARYLQQTFGTRVVMSRADWKHMRTWPQRGTPAPFPDQDMVVDDGDTITLGDTTVTLAITPGHTPGTISPLFPVRDGNTVHHVAYWGGAAMSFLDPEGLEQYIDSAHAWRDRDPSVDVELSNHPFADGSLLKAAALARRRPGEPHPFVTGNAGFRRWVNTIIDCATQVLDQKLASGAGGPD